MQKSVGGLVIYGFLGPPGRALSPWRPSPNSLLPHPRRRRWGAPISGPPTAKKKERSRRRAAQNGRTQELESELASLSRGLRSRPAAAIRLARAYAMRNKMKGLAPQAGRSATWTSFDRLMSLK